MAVLVRWVECTSPADAMAGTKWRADVVRALPADRAVTFTHVLRVGGGPDVWVWRVEPSNAPGRNRAGDGRAATLNDAMRAAEAHLDGLRHMGAEPVDPERRPERLPVMYPPTTYERVEGIGYGPAWLPRAQRRVRAAYRRRSA